MVRGLCIPDGAGICAALSGGSDSVTLLHCARSLGYEVSAVHVNHRIRPGEAERDRDFCISLCRSLDVPLEVGEFDVPETARLEGKTLEEAARDVRYACFAEVCAEHGVRYLATAHNARDNLETVLFNLARGSSGRGLCGIPPSRPLTDDVLVVRPLLRCSKEDILGYLEENSLAYVTDSTNADTAYTRNFIRAELVPRMRRINPSAECAASRLCEALRRDMEYLDEKASELPAGLDAAALAALPPPLMTRYIARLYAEISPFSLEYVHIEAVSALLRRFDGRTVCADLPDGICCEVSRSGLAFLRRRTADLPDVSADADEIVPSPVLPDKLTYFPADGSYLYLSAQNADINEKYIKEHINIYKLFIHKQVSFDKIIGSVYIRARQAGDRYRLRGVGRSVRKLMNELAVPPGERDALPLLCAGEDIIWLPGAEVSDIVYKRPQSGNIFNIYYIK